MLKEYLQTTKQEVEAYLETVLTSPNTEYAELYKAMNYSLMMGGKRIRPILTKAVMDSLGVDWTPYKDMVCAIELIHTYSLVHDDLPAMDNDDYRRGNLTNHRVFGDGLAILAGDGLLTEAFSLVASNRIATDKQIREVILSLASGAGPAGMVGGQAFDLQSEGKILPLEELQILHKGKTGALFKTAVHIGLILGNASLDESKHYLSYADDLGLLFQITDDILDVTGTVEELGKTPGSDQRQEKATYVSILGLNEAKQKALDVAERAKEALRKTKGNTEILEGIVDYLVHRTN